MKLEESRLKIDVINRELLRLMTERMAAAADIAAYKRERGLPVLDPARERGILDAMTAGAAPGLAPYIRAFFSSVMEVSRAYQSGLNAMPGAASAALRRTLNGGLPTGLCVLSLRLTVPDTPDALSSALAELSRGGFRLLAFTARPEEGGNSFDVKLDFAGDPADKATFTLLDVLEDRFPGLTLLACRPDGEGTPCTI